MVDELLQRLTIDEALPQRRPCAGGAIQKIRTKKTMISETVSTR
jgi:hypothetical protein